MIQSGVEVAVLNSERYIFDDDLNDLMILIFSVLPVFIQYGTPDRIFYVGSLQDRNIRTTFETIHTHRGFMKHKCLDGLVELMKERLVCLLLYYIILTLLLTF